MYLFEEYYKRHNIQSLQFFYNTFYVLLECNGVNHIFGAKWSNDFRHPGNFKICLKIVNHNGIEKNDIFHNIMEDSADWNEYEYFMFEFFKNIKLKNKTIKVVKKKEAMLILWELFVYAADGFFSKQSQEIKNHLAISLDKKISQQDRLFNQLLLLQKHNNTTINKMWKNNFEIVLEKYSTWIEKILEPSVLQTF